MPGRWWTISLISLAIAARIAAILVLQSHTVPRSTFEHGEIAANLLAGRGFSIRFLGVDGPTSQQAPLYPALVAASYAIGGIETPHALLLLQLSQAVLGGLLVAAVLMLAREVMPERPWVARTAGLLAALHPTLIYAATHVQVALLAALLLTLVLALAYRAGRTGRWQAAALAGLTLGALVLTDPILGLVTPGLLWAMARGQTAWKPALRLGTLTAAIAALVVSPWVARNYRVHGEFVPVKSSFGYAFWQGNCALSEGTDKVVRASVEKVLDQKGNGLADWNRTLWQARHEAGYIDDIALTPADYAMFSIVNEPERSRILLKRALADLSADPARYPQLCLRRLRYFLLFDETNPKTRNPLYRASHLGLSLVALLGLIVMSRQTRDRLAPTLLTAALITAFHALTIISARFHVPIEPLFCLWAAAGLVPLFMGLLATAGSPFRSSPPAHHIERVGVVVRWLLARVVGIKRRFGNSL